MNKILEEVYSVKIAERVFTMKQSKILNWVLENEGKICLNGRKYENIDVIPVTFHVRLITIILISKQNKWKIKKIKYSGGKIECPIMEMCSQGWPKNETKGLFSMQIRELIDVVNEVEGWVKIKRNMYDDYKSLVGMMNEKFENDRNCWVNVVDVIGNLI